jgi:hypothetical protein
MRPENVKTPNPGNQCLAARQQVCTVNGAVGVETLAKSGSFQAICYDHAARRFVLRNATASQAGRKNVIRLHTDKGSFEMSTDQLVILQSGETTQSAAELTPGARLSGFALTPQTDYRLTSGDSGSKHFDLDHLTTADCAVANWYPVPSVDALGEADVYQVELAAGGQSNLLIWTVGPGGGIGIAIAS